MPPEDQYDVGKWWRRMVDLRPQDWTTYTYTTTTTNTTQAPVVSEDRVRQIVREELAEIMPIDVPDAPPEDMR